MKKKCNQCGDDRYGTSSFCYSCLQANNQQKMKESKTCAKCYEPKDITNSFYCRECRTNMNNKVKYRDMEADFKIELYLFLKQLNEDGGIDAIQAFMIAHYWSEIILYPHLYFNLDTWEQLEYMIDDLNEFLRGEKIQPEKRNFKNR